MDVVEASKKVSKASVEVMESSTAVGGIFHGSAVESMEAIEASTKAVGSMVPGWKLPRSLRKLSAFLMKVVAFFHGSFHGSSDNFHGKKKLPWELFPWK